MTDRQRLVLELLTETPQGLRSIDLGNQIHQAFGCPYCSPVRNCKFSHAAGEDVGRQLRKRELAIKRKASGRWQLTRPPVTGHDPATAPIPF